MGGAIRPARHLRLAAVTAMMALVLAAAAAAPALASSPWSPAASMGSTRLNHTATLLPDGRVLVAGGIDSGGSVLKGAELYDPKADTWTAAASMATERESFTATLLGDGSVLVVGGFGGSKDLGSAHDLASAERYDPASGTWTSAGSMTTARELHTATLLGDGRVLVAGGMNAGDGNLDSAEVYDPSTNTWSPAGTMSDRRKQAAATLLSDGVSVLVSGGDGGSAGTPRATADLFDATTNTWKAAGSMATARDSHSATLLDDHTVLVAGGYGGSAGTRLVSAELYDPGLDTWSATGSMATSREFHTATLLGDGRVLAVGGFSDSSGSVKSTATAESYNPTTKTWASAGSMSSARDGHSATRLQDGRVLVAGGENAASVRLATAELYTPTPPHAYTAAGVMSDATEGQAFSDRQVAFLSYDRGTDPGCDPPGGLSATIDWNDGTKPSAGTVQPATYDSGTNTCTYAVVGSHTYAEEHQASGYSPAVTVTYTGGTKVADTPALVNVVDAPVSLKPYQALAAPQGKPFSGAVASFTDSDPNAAPSDYSATIDWGDGTAASAGLVAGDAASGFTISGSHTYTTFGRHTTTITLTTDSPGAEGASYTGSGSTDSGQPPSPGGPPGAGSPGAGPSAPNASIGAVAATAGGVRATVSCSGAAGQACRIDGLLTARERLSHGKVVSVGASRRTRRSSRTVTVGQASMTVAAGRSVTLVVPLNAAGRRLERRFKRLRATLAVRLILPDGHAIPLTSTRLTFKARKRRRRH